MNLNSQNVFQGYVKEKGGTSLVGANVTILKNGKLFAFSSTDTNGRYLIKNIPSEKYEVFVSCVGMDNHEEVIDINGNTEKILY